MSRRETEFEHGLVTETKKKLKKPPLYKVLLHNDDYTTKEFVVQLLQYVFHKEHTAAVQIMLHVHKKGIGVAGGGFWQKRGKQRGGGGKIAAARAEPLTGTQGEGGKEKQK